MVLGALVEDFMLFLTPKADDLSSVGHRMKYSSFHGSSGNYDLLYRLGLEAATFGMIRLSGDLGS